MLIDLIRRVNAEQKFHIKDEFEFIEFDDITGEDLEQHESVPDVLELWAAVKINYTGQIPESYKALNLIIGDWVEKNLDKLTVTIHNELKGHFNTNYPESNIEALDQIEDSSIWTDQLDYMPIAKPGDNSMIIEIELVLHAEPIGE